MPVTIGTLFGSLHADWKDEVLEDVGKQAAELYNTYRLTLKEGVSLRKLPADQRLEAYAMREPERWAELQGMFPQEYERQMRDWERLNTTRQRRQNDITKSPVVKELQRNSNVPLPAMPGVM